jgi:hypothetical protein
MLRRRVTEVTRYWLTVQGTAESPAMLFRSLDGRGEAA